MLKHCPITHLAPMSPKLEFVLTRWHEQVHGNNNNRQNRQNREYDVSSPVVQAGCSSGHVRAPSSRVYSFYPNEV